ncbi:MAG: alginate lyase family protein [Candidatus Cloacimonetes bacterium]|nr:alginate lyase family protein [Candidatus Cloacimonadota bacterium]
MIIYKRFRKLSQYALYIVHRAVELNIGFVSFWLDAFAGYKAVLPIRIDEGITCLDRDRILNAADKIVAGEYTVFGKSFDFSTKIPWNMDCLTGFAWNSGVLFKKYVQVDVNNNADVKYPRELSRFHHALILGQAFYLTKNIKYYRKYKDDILDWIKENPFMKSINWGCTQDVAIRAVNWLWGIAFFNKEIDKDKQFRKEINRCLYKHGFYIYLYPEKGFYNNHNHYISDLVGQIYLGLYFRNNRYAKDWLEWGIEELYKEIRYQILPSGVSYEKSINYNRFVAEMLFSAIILLHRNGYDIPQDILHRLESMQDFILHYIKPDGNTPVIGDQDDARLHPFSINSNLDHRYLLCIGAVMFNRGDLKYYAGKFYADCAFLLGEKAVTTFDSIDADDTHLSSKPFSDAGFYIIRDNDNYMFINNSGKSKYSELGGSTHTHSDLLSFELVMCNKSFIIDPGTFVYSGDPDLRMHFRSTKMHNTMTVDRQNQNRLQREQLWDFPEDAKPNTIMWKDDSNCVTFIGEHSGYSKLKDPVIHQRKVQYDKTERYFSIADYAIGKGKHHYQLYFHFDNDIELQISDNSVKTMSPDNIDIELKFNCSESITIKCLEELVSKAYGSATKAKMIEVDTVAMGDFYIETIIKRI